MFSYRSSGENFDSKFLFSNRSVCEEKEHINLKVDNLQVYLFGGQVLSWKNNRREELLFVSSKVCLLTSNYKTI